MQKYIFFSIYGVYSAFFVTFATKERKNDGEQLDTKETQFSWIWGAES